MSETCKTCWFATKFPKGSFDAIKGKPIEKDEVYCAEKNVFLKDLTPCEKHRRRISYE